MIVGLFREHPQSVYARNPIRPTVNSAQRVLNGFLLPNRALSLRIMFLELLRGLVEVSLVRKLGIRRDQLT